jgi:hypothetical protein
MAYRHTFTSMAALPSISLRRLHGESDLAMEQ